MARIALAVAACLSAAVACAADVLPQGGHYVAGAGTIATQGGALTVTQPGSTRGVIDWTGFSIGAGNTVTFANGTGATLNRVTGGVPSTLLGDLNATGSVYLVNPQGVLVGTSGVISTGGRFVASALDVPNNAFMAGGTLTFSGITNGHVVNLGKISSSGGDVFLISHDVVENAGTVSAPNGTAEYVAGQQVVLYESSASRQAFVQIASHGDVTDRGITEAAQINLEAADGNIYALAGGGSRIRATGTATRDGHIWLVAGNGHVTQQGTLQATNANASGGTVDTIADTLTLGTDAMAQAGTWNVSTPNLTIDSASAGAFVRSLNAGTSVDATATGTNGASGDLRVASSLQWTGPASLALVAFNGVSVAPATTIANTGSGSLTLRTDAAAIDNRGSLINEGTVDWTNSSGIVSLMVDMKAAYSPGTLLGSSGNPGVLGLATQITAYRLVNSVADLQAVGDDMSGNYALGRDIQANNAAFTTLGSNGYTIGTAFSGQFDGMFHTISGVSPNLGAIFGNIEFNGYVRNLRVDGHPVVSDALPFYDGIGLLAIYNSGLIVNTFTSGTNSCQCVSATLAGLVGENYGYIFHSGSSVDVKSGGAAAGLVALNYGQIADAYSTGSVTGTLPHSAVAGLVLGNARYVANVFATGQVVSANPYKIAPLCVTCGLLRNGYWDVQTTGQPASVNQTSGAQGLTTAQMSNPASFAGPDVGLGFDFGPNGTWVMPAGATHPVLRWQVEH